MWETRALNLLPLQLLKQQLRLRKLKRKQLKRPRKKRKRKKSLRRQEDLQWLTHLVRIRPIATLVQLLLNQLKHSLLPPRKSVAVGVFGLSAVSTAWSHLVRKAKSRTVSISLSINSSMTWDLSAQTKQPSPSKSNQRFRLIAATLLITLASSIRHTHRVLAIDASLKQSCSTGRHIGISTTSASWTLRSCKNLSTTGGEDIASSNALVTFMATSVRTPTIHKASAAMLKPSTSHPRSVKRMGLLNWMILVFIKSTWSLTLLDWSESELSSQRWTMTLFSTHRRSKWLPNLSSYTRSSIRWESRSPSSLLSWSHLRKKSQTFNATWSATSAKHLSQRMCLVTLKIRKSWSWGHLNPMRWFLHFCKKVAPWLSWILISLSCSASTVNQHMTTITILSRATTSRWEIGMNPRHRLISQATLKSTRLIQQKKSLQTSTC